MGLWHANHVVKYVHKGYAYISLLFCHSLEQLFLCYLCHNPPSNVVVLLLEIMTHLDLQVVFIERCAQEGSKHFDVILNIFLFLLEVSDECLDEDPGFNRRQRIFLDLLFSNQFFQIINCC